MHKPKAYFLLGRYGDICNILPVIEYEAKQNNYKPRLFIAKDFVSLIEGCSYVEPIIWKDNFWNYEPAIYWAQQSLDGYEFINCSLSGRGYLLIKKCRSFVRESWRLANCSVPWGHLPLTFDRRSPEREKAFLEKLNIKDGEPLILVATKGNSSPFNANVDLFAYLRNTMTDFRVIDMSYVKAERFYDLIALFERAHCLVTIDTGLLHLARAVPNLPVITLIPVDETKWLQSDWDPQHILRMVYNEVVPNIDVLVKAATEGNNFIKQKIHFITSYDKTDEDAMRRIKFAVDTRENENSYSKRWNFMEFPDELLEKRNSMSLGDSKKLPFIKDMIDYACKDAADYDIIMICNADICFTPGITGWILHEVERHGAVFFHKSNFNKLTFHLINEDQVSRGHYYVGSDAFAFSKEWWDKNRDVCFDVIFGREAWDMLFRNMVRRAGGVNIPLALYHEAHPAKWLSPTIHKNGATEYNLTLGKKWLNTYGGDWNDWRFDLDNSKNLRYK